MEAHKIITKQTSINCKMAITKNRALLNIKPRAIHKKISHPTTRPPTKPTWTYNYQPQRSSQRNIPHTKTTFHDKLCYAKILRTTHKHACVHTHQGIILDKRGPSNTQIGKQFNREIYDSCLKRLTKGKAPGPNNIPNDIIKTLLTPCQDLLFLFFNHCYKQRAIPHYWKHSKILLLHKKEDPTHLFNYRPIALANIIYKLCTSTLIVLLTNYGITPQRNTTRHIQTIITTLEDA